MEFSNPIEFAKEIIGSTFPIRKDAQWDFVQENHLEKITAHSNVYPTNGNSEMPPSEPLRRRRRRSISISPPYRRASQQFNAQMLVQQQQRSSKSSGDSSSSPYPTDITEVRLAGNVTGILIPNAKKIIVRVIVPIMDGDIELPVDRTFIQWKTVSVAEAYILNKYYFYVFFFCRFHMQN